MTTPIAAGALAGGTVLKAFGTHKQISAENQANAYNAQVASNNAQILSQQASIASQKAGQAQRAGEQQEKRFRERGEQLKGSQRALYGSSGVVVDQGSAMDVAQDTAEQIELDALNIAHNTALQVFDFEQEARNLQFQSGEASSQADMLRSRKRSSFLPVMGDLLSGLGAYAGTVGFGGGGSSRSGSSSRGTSPYRRSLAGSNPFAGFGGF